MRAFEAAGRTGSFAAAAAKLHVSPAAISRMVKLLEERLGLALFERRANRLAPTTAGARYLAGLSPLLDGLAALTEEVAALGGRQVLTLGVGPTFAIRWLIPRLVDWQQRQPGWRCGSPPAAPRCPSRRTGPAASGWGRGTGPASSPSRSSPPT
ncbi:LysR family transcriptional regulator [Dankookia sp. P2]|uniref:LysR family transcriptional regulator n=1 Tax=Dankookia sp. P2 TaxID=3423955 RepID=UPI003D679501